MQIRKTTFDDIGHVAQIYAEAREFMRENGNPTQWKNGNPSIELARRDVLEKKSHVCVDGGAPIAVFYFAVEREPVYDSIKGKWLDENAYGVIHRIAKLRDAPKGVGRYCIEWCLAQHGNIKIDTHENNAPMRKLLENLGFAYCGIVRYPDGGERIAFQKHLEKL
ncbi:MAG: GNAT family N-acetyltransferase [Oscillospiraceae bacterium]|nr:GNAT family N-acetyltransferase [Oscillospiraceae bacterium]